MDGNRKDLLDSKLLEKRKERTKRIAHEIYQNRLLLGKPGIAQSDWETAESIVQSPWRTALFVLNRPLIKLRKPVAQAFRWFLFSLPTLEWVKLLAVPLVLATAGSIISGQLQREANQNAALKAYFDKLETLTFEQNLLAENPDQGAIVLARGRTIAALRELDLARRTQLIAFLQASGLSRLNPSKNEQEPIISFRGQNLSTLDLRGINLFGADFTFADLSDANLHHAILFKATLSYADLSDVNLRYASLVGANLHYTVLIGATLRYADLSDASLKGANLKGADLSDGKLHRADLSNARNLTKAQLTLAKLCNTKLPPDIDLEHDRNCKELAP